MTDQKTIPVQIVLVDDETPRLKINDGINLRVSNIQRLKSH